MSSKTDFTEEEWERLGRAPLIAGMAISFADPGGPIEAIKESSAALKTLVEAANDSAKGDFVQAVAQDVAAKAQKRENPLSGFKPDRHNAVNDILDELRAVNALLADKAAPEDAADYREWIKTAAQQAALAAKEGGFFGIGAERVSEREQKMLENLGEIFSATPPQPQP